MIAKAFISLLYRQPFVDGVEKTWTCDSISLMRELGRDDSNTLIAPCTGSLPFFFGFRGTFFFKRLVFGFCLEIVFLSFSFVEFLRWTVHMLWALKVTSSIFYKFVCEKYLLKSSDKVHLCAQMRYYIPSFLMKGIG